MPPSAILFWLKKYIVYGQGPIAWYIDGWVIMLSISKAATG